MLTSLVLIAILFFIVMRLNKRIVALEQRLEGVGSVEEAPQRAPDVDESADWSEPAPEPNRPSFEGVVGKMEGVTEPADLPDLPIPPREPPSPPRRVVFRQSNMDAVTAWLRDNWFLAVAALSLVLAAVFLVQYGIENGLLTPFWRVMGAASLGVGLIWGGEFLRRRWGDGGAGTAFLPSTFSGAGIVALFAAALSAHHLYALIGSGEALFWLVAIAVVAMVLGWFYGPFLAVVGLLGSTAAPFLIGGSSDAPELFYYYFAIVGMAGLAVDAVRRWAWVSALGLIFAYAAAYYIYVLGAGDAHLVAFALILGVAAVLIPPLQLTPTHSGTLVLQSVRRKWRSAGWPEFPTRLAFGALIGSSVAGFVVMAGTYDAMVAWLGLALILLLYTAVVFWTPTAPAISDVALAAPSLLVLAVMYISLDYDPLYAEFRAGINRLAEEPFPRQASILAAMGAYISALALIRALGRGDWKHSWAGGAAVTAPAVMIALELFWDPADVMGPYAWALHVMAVAALMTFGAERIARQDGADHRRAAYLVVAALVMISFALVVLFSKGALTVALAVMVAGAAAIDRRFDMALVARFASFGAIAVTWRLVVDPGYGWATYAGWLEMGFTFVASLGLLWAAWWLAPQARAGTRVILSSAGWLGLAVFANVLLRRTIGAEDEFSHWVLSLYALVWLSSAVNQLWRLQIGGKLMVPRLILAAVFASIAALALGSSLVDENPLLRATELVRGPLIFDTLMVAYLLPALPFALVAWRFGHLPNWSRIAAATIAAGFAALYVGLEIRRFWQGDMLASATVLDGELYTYTVALLVASVAALFIAFFKRSDMLRKIAVAGIALTIAKVFLLDMSGLAGLYRVASFLGLGLSLAGLAWIVRQMNAQWDRPED